MRNKRRRISNGLLLTTLLTVLAFASVGCVEDTYTVCSSGCTYTSIQAAIDAAKAGETIEVCSGTYYENVNVNKQVLLQGVDTGAGQPVVDAGGTGSAFTFSADYCVLDGFTAIHASDAGIRVYSNNNLVSNNTISNNNHGISLESSCNNTLTNNTASNNYYGISLFSSCNNNILTGNTVNSNTNYGIYLYSSCSNNTLTYNTALNNYYGIYLYSSCSNNTLTYNTASNNSYRGIFLGSSSNNNSLMGNTADSNNDHGISIEASCNNTVTGNMANANYFHGIHLATSSTNALTNNTASNNKIGIRLTYSSNNNALTGNTANANDKYGLYLDSSNSNTLTRNTANANNRSGMYVPSSSRDNYIYNNYFDNPINAHDSGSNIWNSTQTPVTNIIGGPWLGGNYWSDYAGEDTNGDGFGDTQLPHKSSGYIVNGGDWLPLVTAEPAIFDTRDGN
ncbi:MAG: right-handed parallel beta-helix repeat-containing protein [Candidatus Methanospirareceae archaeon]